MGSGGVYGAARGQTELVVEVNMPSALCAVQPASQVSRSADANGLSRWSPSPNNPPSALPRVLGQDTRAVPGSRELSGRKGSARRLSGQYRLLLCAVHLVSGVSRSAAQTGLKTAVPDPNQPPSALPRVLGQCARAVSGSRELSGRKGSARRPWAPSFSPRADPTREAP
jgi:hypothetical protein